MPSTEFSDIAVVQQRLGKKYEENQCQKWIVGYLKDYKQRQSKFCLCKIRPQTEYSKCAAHPITHNASHAIKRDSFELDSRCRWMQLPFIYITTHTRWDAWSHLVEFPFDCCKRNESQNTRDTAIWRYIRHYTQRHSTGMHAYKGMASEKVYIAAVPLLRILLFEAHGIFYSNKSIVSLALWLFI